MADYRLSRRAEADLLGIYAYTDRTFGRYQADAYHAGLEHTFGLLAQFPLIGKAADELVQGFRRFRFQSHYVFYTEETDHVFVRALIHVRMNLRGELFE